MSHPIRRERGRPTARRGTVLIVTMILVFALAAMTLVLCRSMRVEMIASANYAAMLQASAIERGAEQYLLAMLTELSGDLTSMTEADFEAVQVGDGWFWVLRPDYGDAYLPVFGLTGESAKLNINIATSDQLMILPYMTDDVASAIVDWRDTDSEITQGGAEDEYYLSQPDAYYCKNAPFETVEELMLVRGFVPELLYGEGPAQPLGVQSMFSSSGSSMVNDVWLQRGLYDLLTIYGTESTTAADGTQRVSLTDRNQLREMLNTQLGSSRANEIMSAAGGGDLRDIFDLYFRGRMTADELSQIADYINPTNPTQGQGSGQQPGQSQTQSQVRGRIDVNTAPREVLLTLPGLDTSDVDKLITQRRGNATLSVNSIGWVAEALGQKAVGLGSRITGRSYQYSALILAASGNGRGFKQVRIVIDTSGTTPQIVYRRDLTDRGWPMEPEMLASLRAGEGPGSWSGTTGTTLGDLLR